MHGINHALSAVLSWNNGAGGRPPPRRRLWRSRWASGGVCSQICRSGGRWCFWCRCAGEGDAALKLLVPGFLSVTAWPAPSLPWSLGCLCCRWSSSCSSSPVLAGEEGFVMEWSGGSCSGARSVDDGGSCGRSPAEDGEAQIRGVRGVSPADARQRFSSRRPCARRVYLEVLQPWCCLGAWISLVGLAVLFCSSSCCFPARFQIDLGRVRHVGVVLLFLC